jgi:hypothetical protein
MDNFNKLYTNPTKEDQPGGVEVVWNGHTSQISVQKSDATKG